MFNPVNRKGAKDAKETRSKAKGIIETPDLRSPRFISGAGVDRTFASSRQVFFASFAHLR